MSSITDNPLFGHDRLPAFDRVRAEHVEPAIRQLLPKMASDLAELERTIQPTWRVRSRVSPRSVKGSVMPGA